jgi:hypothetical protein
MDPTDRAFHDAVRPIWSTDGACIVTEVQTDDIEPFLKRIRIFDSIGVQLTDVRGKSCLSLYASKKKKEKKN